MVTPTKVILLACGSFNPPTNMHLRMFEVARDHLHRLGNYLVIGGLLSPVHDGYGKKELVPVTHRIAMIKLALQNSNWIQISDWESKQETWTRTKNILQYHQNHVNAILNKTNNMYNEEDACWVPNNIRNECNGPVQIKLICGADLLESFGTPGLWSDSDIEAIVGQHGLVVVTRDQTNPMKFIYDSDILTRLMGNIIIVTEWIRNEVSSSKIRRALKRSESVKYLIDDRVINYIHRHNLYDSKDFKYMSTSSSIFPTPSPDQATHNNNNFCIEIPCMPLAASEPPSCSVTTMGQFKHPGQAIKVITDASGKSKILSNEASLKRPACLL